MPGQGSIFIGTKGVMLLPHGAIPTLLPADEFRDFKMPQIEPLNHYLQFVDAVLGKAKTTPLVRLFRPADRGRAARTAGHPFPEDHSGVELGQDEVQELARSHEPRPPDSIATVGM